MKIGAVGLAGILLFAAWGCNGTVGVESQQDAQDSDSSVQGSKPSNFVIESIGIAGTTNEPAAVKVGEVADQDGVADTKWQATFKLDDGTSAESLPADSGGLQSHELTVTATPTSGGADLAKTVKVTLHE